VARCFSSLTGLIDFWRLERRPAIPLAKRITGIWHDAEKHVLGLDPRRDPHPGQARAQALRKNIRRNFLESITFMRFDGSDQNAS
jgi:hypothetical protein